MSTKDFGNRREKPLAIYRQLEVSILNSIRKILPDHVIEGACRECHYVYRHRLLTPTVIVLHLIMAAIWPEESFNACWQVLWAAAVAWSPDLAGLSPARGSVSIARNRLPREVMDKIFHWLSQQAQHLSAPYDQWRGHRVVLADGTCLTASDEPQLHQEFGTQVNSHGPRRYPLVRLVSLCLSHTMTVLSYRIGSYATDENVLLTPQLNALREGDLLVADRHFAGAHFYHAYREKKLEFITRIHQCVNLSKVKRRVVFSNNDFLGYLKIGKPQRQKNPDLPRTITVRFIRVTLLIRGRKQDTWLVTSLLDPAAYPAEEMAQVYGGRWRIETLFRELKIQGHADLLRSKKADGVHREIAARMAAINILRSLILEAATQYHLEDPLRLSFVGTVRTVLTFAPAFAVQPIMALPSLYRAMLKEIASHQVPWRPGRNEPRAITHNPKSYPILKSTRKRWTQEYAA
jgi:hypothetical protein